MFENKRNLYLKILIYFTLSVFITLLATSTILYINFESIVLKQFYANDMDTLTQTGRGVSALAEMALTVSNQIYNDANVSKLMYYDDPGPQALRAADDQLTNYRLSLPFIDSVYVYNGKLKSFYINSIISKNESREAIQKWEDFDDPGILGMIESFRSYKPYRPIARKFVVPGPQRRVKHYYTFILYDTFLVDDIGRAVFVNINQDWINSFIRARSESAENRVFIMDTTGRVVSDSEPFPMLTNLSGLSFASRILEDEGFGSFFDMIGETEFFITYTAADDLGWRYIRCTARDQIFKKIEEMKSLTILLSLAILLIGIGISFFFVRRIYAPIDDLFNRLKRISSTEGKNIKLLRQMFFRDLLLGYGMYDNNTIEIKLEELEASLVPDSSFRLILAKIDGYDRFVQKNSAVDCSLFKGVIMEKCAEHLGKLCWSQVLDMGNDGILCILNGSDSSEGLQTLSLDRRIGAIQSYIVENTRLSLSFAMSGSFRHIQNLAHEYSQVLEASLYRMYRGHGCIIHGEEVLALERKEYEYPVQKEKQLVSSLLGEKIDDAKAAYDEIIASAYGYPLNVFNLMLSRLAFCVDDAIMTVKKNNAVDLDMERNIAVTRLTKAETLGEINGKFYSTFDEIHALLSDRKSNRNERLVQQINEYIESNYMQASLYIDSLAEHLAKSSTYISHVYKQNTGTTILDKIIEVRMGKARELLLTTQFSVAEIAEKIGFSSASYFFKVFKKIHGATPALYRNNGGMN